MRTFILAFALAFASCASADSITFQFTGTVTHVTIDDFGTGIKPLDTFQGSYTFDSGAINTSPTSTGGSYDSFIKPYGMTVDIGANNFSISDDALSIGVQNSAVDFYNVVAENFTSPGLVFFLDLQDPSGAALTSGALPLSPPDLAAFSQRDFRLREVDLSGNQTEVDARIDSLIPCGSCGSVVPEPTMTWLVAAVPALAAWMKFRKRSTSCS